MWKTTLKGLMAHKLRMFLTALAVVLGVGFIAGTYVLTDTMNEAFDELIEDTSAGVDVYVRSESEFEAQLGGSRQPFAEDVLTTVQGVEGVETATGSVQGYAQLVDRKGEAVTTGGAPTLGFNWTPEPLNPLRLRAGNPPESPDEVVIDARTAEDTGFNVGDAVTVLTLKGPRQFTISGVAGVGEADNFGGATVVVFDTATAQELFDREGRFDAIEVAGTSDVTTNDLVNRIADELPEGVQAESSASVANEQADAIKEGLGFFNTLLLIFAGVALFVGAFIIHNTFAITIAQRTHEFALLRALGASGRQVMASVFIEALLVGVIASVVGLGVGFLIAVGLQATLSAFGIELPSTSPVLLPRTVIVAVSVGVIVTLVSSLTPARRASRTSPMAAIRESAPQTYRVSRRRIIAGLALTAIGVVTLLFGLFGDPGQPAAVVGLGAAVIFFGVNALTPIFAGPLANVLGRPVSALFKTPGKLARGNAARNPKRTASTAAALMIGLALVASVGIMGASAKASTNKIFEESLTGDFLIQSSSFTGFTISPELATQLESKSELAAVVPFQMGQFRQDGSDRFAIAANPDGLEQVADIEVTEGDLSSLSDGGIFLFQDTAEDLGLSVGDNYSMVFAATGEKEIPVEGTFDNKSLIGSDYLISSETYAENFSDPSILNIIVKADDGASMDDARAAVDEVAADYPNVEVLNQAQAQETSADQINTLLNLINALLGLSLVIALLGITNTLALSVFERTRELGLLRAVGMTRRQTRKMVRWEAVIISIIGAILGIIVGTFFGWALVEALATEGITEFAVPAGQLALYLVLAGVAGVLAAIPPARRAARLNVLDAIATE